MRQDNSLKSAGFKRKIESDDEKICYEAIFEVRIIDQNLAEYAGKLKSYSLFDPLQQTKKLGKH